MVEFIVPGKPQGKARPRLARNGHTYTPRDTVEYENRVVRAYLRKYDEVSFRPEESLSVTIEAVFEPPASVSQVRRARMIHGEYPTKKPDLDNICKAIMDAMNGVVYPDDKQVVAVSMKKVYGDTAGVAVTVERIEK